MHQASVCRNMHVNFQHETITSLQRVYRLILFPGHHYIPNQPALIFPLASVPSAVALGVWSGADRDQIRRAWWFLIHTSPDRCEGRFLHEAEQWSKGGKLIQLKNPQTNEKFIFLLLYFICVCVLRVTEWASVHEIWWIADFLWQQHAV